ncbi:MAG: alpha/beta fold hydrolase [Actinomycetota bacterium]
MTIAAVNGLDLWFDERGEPGAPVFLLGGANSQGTMWWTEEFLAELVAHGLRPIRSDWRDIGRSSWIDPATPLYDLDDLTADVLGLMDHLGLEHAHFVGFSMGGQVAQTIALRAPERTRSVTLIATTTMDPSLPPIPAATMEAMAATVAEPPEDAMLSRLRFLIGNEDRFDEAWWRTQIHDLLARGLNPACRHAAAVQSTGDRTDALAAIKAPTLVIHGARDPLRPPAHGRALAAAIPGASLLEIEPMGHEVPVDLADFRSALVAHLTTVSPQQGPI